MSGGSRDVDDLIRLIEGNEFAAAAAMLESHPELATQESCRDDVGGKLRGATALHWAAHRGALELCRQLIAGVADVNARGARWWRTPLAWAADAGCADAVALLLEHGADVNSDAFGQTTALHAVAQGGSTSGARDPSGYRRTAEILIVHGVDIDRCTSYDGSTALDDAVRKGNEHVAAVLRAHGATRTQGQ